MLNETIKTQAHTTQQGMLNLSVNVGLADADVAVLVQVRPLVPEGDENGWPKDFFERVAGSMPELQRAPQKQFEERSPFLNDFLPDTNACNTLLRQRDSRLVARRKSVNVADIVFVRW